MRQHGIFRKTPRFRYTWFSRPARLFDPRPSTCQYSLQPGGLFDLGAKEYQRLHPNLTPIFTFNISSHVFPRMAKTRRLTLSFRGMSDPRSRTGGPATRAGCIETAAEM